MGTTLLPKRPNHQVQASDAPLPQDERTLVEQVKAGQTQSYGELVRRYQDRIFNTCWRICGHLEDARDLTQEAFLKAFENLDGYRHESGFYTWVFRVAANLAISHRRSAARKRALLDGKANLVRGQAEALVRRMADDGEADASGTSEETGRVTALLQTLDDEQRAVIVLRDIEGFDYQQIGEILGLPVGTVKSRLHRARMTLRQGLVSASCARSQ